MTRALNSSIPETSPCSSKSNTTSPFSTSTCRTAAPGSMSVRQTYATSAFGSIATVNGIFARIHRYDPKRAVTNQRRVTAVGPRQPSRARGLGAVLVSEERVGRASASTAEPINTAQQAKKNLVSARYEPNLRVTAVSSAAGLFSISARHGVGGAGEPWAGVARPIGFDGARVADSTYSIGDPNRLRADGAT
jgi:hypothetical protein